MRKITLLTMSVGLFLAIGLLSSCAISEEQAKKYHNPQEPSSYTNQVLEQYGIDPNGLEIIAENVTDKHAYYLFAINSENGLVDQLNSIFGEPVYSENDQLPRYDQGTLAKQLNDEENVTGWTRLVSGNSGEKTKSIDVYVTSNGDGEKHLYIFK